MNAIAYRAGYVLITCIEKIGHLIPRPVLSWWIRRIPSETERTIEYFDGKIDVDQFDFSVDLELAVFRAYNRAGRR